jgi:formylglycine-generating enzyme required for sulfatase activity
VLAEDKAGHVNAVSSRLRFAWETGDKLLWRQDNSALVYHDAVKSKNMDPFWMQETEVTNRQYALFLEAQGGTYDFGKWFWPVEAPGQLGNIFCPRSEEWKHGSLPRAIPRCSRPWDLLA